MTSEENKKKYINLGKVLEDILMFNQNINSDDIDTLYLMPEIKTLSSKIEELGYHKTKRKNYKICITFEITKLINIRKYRIENDFTEDTALSNESIVRMAVIDEIRFKPEIVDYHIYTMTFNNDKTKALVDTRYEYVVIIDAYSEKQAIKLAENRFCPEDFISDIKKKKILNKSTT